MVGLCAAVVAVFHERLGVILVPDVSDDALKGRLAHDLAGGSGLDEVVVRRVVSIDSDVFGVPEHKGVLFSSYVGLKGLVRFGDACVGLDGFELVVSKPLPGPEGTHHPGLIVAPACFRQHE